MDKKSLKFVIAVFFVIAGAGLRIVPHAPNFAPIAAIALFSGVYFSKKIALAIPVLAMLVSDIFLGFYDPKIMLFVYGSFVLCAILGFWLKNNKSWHTIGGGVFFSSALFFLVTNFAVWVFSPWYAKTFTGLVQCYVMALPFFRNSLLADAFYGFMFFGAYELAMFFIKKKFEEKESSKTLARI